MSDSINKITPENYEREEYSYVSQVCKYNSKIESNEYSTHDREIE